MSSELISQEQALFAEPEIEAISKTEFVKKLKAIVGNGGEISWLSTEARSFEWAEINTDVKKFLKESEMILDIRMVDVGISYPESKETEYSSCKIE